MRLDEFPINLHGDVIFELVKALESRLNEYEYYSESDREVKYWNLLCVEKNSTYFLVALSTWR